MLDLSVIKKIHFIGIGGVSLSSFARFFHEKHYEISGTDKDYSDTLVALSEIGIRVWSGFEPQLIGTPDLVVYSSAVPSTDPELSYCKACGIKCVERYELLSAVSAMFPCTIAISGTHGKTTVTSMCADVMKNANLPFYAHIGGFSHDCGNYYYGGDKYFLCEACEYRRSLLSLSPYVGVVLNAEFDHPDTYRSKGEVYDTFDTFLEHNTARGLKIVNGDTEYYHLRQLHNNPITFGFGENNDYRATDIVVTQNGCFGCCITHFGNPLVDINLKVIGRHNLTNALACVAVCHSIGIPVAHIKNALESYSGVSRRFEYIGKFYSARVYCDYAHHPTEISASIDAARLLGNKRITVVFQPHTFSRTSALITGFIQTLSAANRLIIVKEFAARETNADGESAYSLFRQCINDEKYYCENIIEAADILTKKTAPDDLILVLGAGNINSLCKILVSTI